ncbi:unnamed protein product [Heterobilharzia americana]|nr:unnamed protein product [Heterobilharzia americana]CAH8466350.1 unnamed protein product [Heterobilharzia americana]
MGRKKIEIKFIKDEKNRLVTFAKRKSGLFKKAYELSVLCECEIALLVFTRSNRLYQYASVTVDHALQRLKKHHRANEFLSNSDMERLTKRRMRPNCNGLGITPQQPYSNIKNEESNNGDDDDDEDEEEEEEEQNSMLNVKQMNNNCNNTICQVVDVKKQEFDQVDMQSSNVRFVIDTQPTFNIHSQRSMTIVGENHMRPVNTLSLPPNPLISSTNTTTSEYLTHIQPVLSSYTSNTQLPFSSDSHLVQYHRPLHPSTECSSTAPFTCNNHIINSKPLSAASLKSTNQPLNQGNNILLSDQPSMPYLIHHSSSAHSVLPANCSNRNNGHLVDDSFMNSSLTHSYCNATVMNSSASHNFPTSNTSGPTQCTLLTPVPYTQELKADQPIFILSSVVTNNTNHKILNANLNSSITVKSEMTSENELQDMPRVTDEHNFSGLHEQHRQMNDYRSDVYENRINHFASNSMNNIDKSISSTTAKACSARTFTPSEPDIISQCNASNNPISESSVLLVRSSDASSQTPSDIVDLDCLSSSASTSLSTVILTTSKMSTTNHDSHTNNDNSNNVDDNNSSNEVKSSGSEMTANEESSSNSAVVPQHQQQSRQRKIPAMKHLQLPSTCSSTLLRQTSIPKGYFLSTPEVINELGRLDGQRNTNSSVDSPDVHPLSHAMSPADLIYRLGLHQLLSLSPAPPNSREPPPFPPSQSPTPSSLPSNSNSGNLQNTQASIVNQSSCADMLPTNCEFSEGVRILVRSVLRTRDLDLIAPQDFTQGCFCLS